MFVVHLLAGQSMKTGLLSSILSSGKLSRSLTHKGSNPGSLRYDVGSVLWNEPWKAAVNVKPANNLLARQSAWLLFGLCTFSIAAGTGTLVGPAALAEQSRDMDEDSPCEGPLVTAAVASHGKQVVTNYSIIGIPGDGRCLFRAVAHGAHVCKRMLPPSESLQRESADALRGKVVDELVKRREETEWLAQPALAAARAQTDCSCTQSRFIEGNFDSYTRRMRQPHVWGGEPELLMASHVLRMPIMVYMFDQRAKGLISIAEYGQEYGKENPVPIRVLYHGFGHYDALELHSQ